MLAAFAGGHKVRIALVGLHGGVDPIELGLTKRQLNEVGAELDAVGFPTLAGTGHELLEAMNAFADSTGTRVRAGATEPARVKQAERRMADLAAERKRRVLLAPLLSPVMAGCPPPDALAEERLVWLRGAVAQGAQVPAPVRDYGRRRLVQFLVRYGCERAVAVRLAEKIVPGAEGFIRRWTGFD